MADEFFAGEVQAVDAHGHYGDYDQDEISELQREIFFSANVEEVLRRARHARTQFTIVSPLSGLTPVGRLDVLEANEEAAMVVDENEDLLQYAIINPRQRESYAQAADILQRPKCVGIKIHPESHQYPIAEHGDPVFEFAAKHRTVVLAHSGDVNSAPDDYVPFADRYPEAKIILAHLGNGGAAAGSPELQVRALQRAKGDNLYIDTSSARSILPGLLEWAVKEVGADRILYGTDTPVYYAPMQWARVVCTDLSAEEKRKILRENAFALFGLQSYL
tara:strand:- start:676 stop:1503 length:828 start_codon:yes stop_codon:yes gene_type:complete